MICDYGNLSSEGFGVPLLSKCPRALPISVSHTYLEYLVLPLLIISIICLFIMLGLEKAKNKNNAISTKVEMEEKENEM